MGGQTRFDQLLAERMESPEFKTRYDRMTALLRTAAARDPYVRSSEMPGFPICRFCMSVLGKPHTVECWWRQCQEVVGE